MTRAFMSRCVDAVDCPPLKYPSVRHKSRGDDHASAGCGLMLVLFMLMGALVRWLLPAADRTDTIDWVLGITVSCISSINRVRRAVM